MTRTNVPSDEPLRSEIIEGLERLREQRISRKSKTSETDEAAGTRKDDSPVKKQP